MAALQPEEIDQVDVQLAAKLLPEIARPGNLAVIHKTYQLTGWKDLTVAITKGFTDIVNFPLSLKLGGIEHQHLTIACENGHYGIVRLLLMEVSPSQQEMSEAIDGGWR